MTCTSSLSIDELSFISTGSFLLLELVIELPRFFLFRFYFEPEFPLYYCMGGFFCFEVVGV